MPAKARTTRWQRSKTLYYRHLHLHWVTATHPLYRLSASPRPCKDGLTLLWPIPWKFSVPAQHSPLELATGAQKPHRAAYSVLRGLRLFQRRDTPPRCLYRLYEAVCAGRENDVMEESQYWFHCQRGWALRDIPDPRDPDPARYAVLAALADALVLSFNHKIANGLRRGVTMDRPDLIAGFKRERHPPFECAPDWAATVPPLEGTLILRNMDVRDPDDPFARRNIRADVNQLWNY